MSTITIKLTELKKIIRNFLLKEESLIEAYRQTTIQDLQDNFGKYFPTAYSENEIQLVSDSQDVEFIHEMFPKSKVFGGFFVKVGDGDYDNIYGFEGSIPYLYKSVTKIK